MTLEELKERAMVHERGEPCPRFKIGNRYRMQLSDGRIAWCRVFEKSWVNGVKFRLEEVIK